MIYDFISFGHEKYLWIPCNLLHLLSFWWTNCKSYESSQLVNLKSLHSHLKRFLTFLTSIEDWPKRIIFHYPEAFFEKKWTIIRLWYIISVGKDSKLVLIQGFIAISTNNFSIKTSSNTAKVTLDNKCLNFSFEQTFEPCT